MIQKKKKAYNRGIFAERFAALWLQLKGYKILERRYKTAVGEIDLIARKKNTIAFIEVKVRRTKLQALESVTPHMRKRIERAALYYISQNDCAAYDLRLDVIAVSVSPFGGYFIHHLDNAWQRSA